MGGAVSSGRDNNELIDNLVGGKFIRTGSVERVFRALDRADYMTKLSRDQAYKDLAWRDGSLHLSAPCIYSEVMEGLELRPGVSFLNIGSGTGYLSTLVGLVIGASGISHGVEIVPSVVEYANKRLGQFMANSATLDELDFCEPKFYCGDGLRLAPLAGGYDRVYCGAGCPVEYENYFKQLLKVGGILIMPLNDSLLQIRRTDVTEWTTRSLLNVSFASLRVPAADDTTDLLRLDEQSPPRLCALSRSAIRTALRETLRRHHPELREPPPCAPPAKRQCPRRIRIPVDEGAGASDDLAAGLDALHDLDRDAGGAEMNALLSLVLSMGTNRGAGSLRVLDTDGDDDGEPQDFDLQLPSSDRSDDDSSSEAEAEAEVEAEAEAAEPAHRQRWGLRNRDVIVFSIENNLPREQDDRHASRSHTPSPAPSSPRFGADESTYPPEYPAHAHDDGFNTDEEGPACECNDPTCNNYTIDNDTMPQQTTRVTRSQTKSMAATTPSGKSTPDTESTSNKSTSKSVGVESTDTTPSTRSSTKSANSDSSVLEQPGSSKSGSDSSKSESKARATRSKSSKQSASAVTRKPVTRSDSNRSKTAGKRITRSSATKQGKCSVSKTDCGRNKSKLGAKWSIGIREDSPASDVGRHLGSPSRPGTSAMEWESEHNMDVEDDSDSEPTSPPTSSSRRKTDSGVGDEVPTPSPTPSSSSPPTTSSSYTAMSADEIKRVRRKLAKRRRRNVTSHSSSRDGSPTPPPPRAAACSPPPPRVTSGALRVRLSTLMRQSVQQLPLPLQIKRYVNFYRILQL